MRYLSMLALLASANALAADTQLDAEAKSLIKPFAEELQATVAAAMQSGGPVAAVNACKISAPVIASKHSSQSWKIGRTSLRVRNPANSPDQWEEAVLKRFAEEARQGAPIASLGHGERVGNEYRYMQAIGTGELCLKCHGQQVSDEIGRVLRDQYPDDTATGFALGDLRGAFTLRKALSE